MMIARGALVPAVVRTTGRNRQFFDRELVEALAAARVLLRRKPGRKPAVAEERA
jgi:hypothetical protein